MAAGDSEELRAAFLRALHGDAEVPPVALRTLSDCAALSDEQLLAISERARTPGAAWSAAEQQAFRSQYGAEAYEMAEHVLREVVDREIRMRGLREGDSVDDRRAWLAALPVTKDGGRMRPHSIQRALQSVGRFSGLSDNQLGAVLAEGMPDPPGADWSEEAAGAVLRAITVREAELRGWNRTKVGTRWPDAWVWRQSLAALA